MLARRIVDLTLLLGVLVGGAWAWRLGVERDALEADLVRLSARTGELTVGNPKLIHARAVPSDGPLEFGWRIYVPVAKSLRGGTAGSVTLSSFPGPEEWSVRVAVREDRGELQLYSLQSGNTSSSSGLGGLGDRALADFLRGRWDRVVVEQFGRDGLAVADPGKPLTLLRLSLPPDLIEEAWAKLPPGSQRLIPELYSLTIP